MPLIGRVNHGESIIGWAVLDRLSGDVDVDQPVPPADLRRKPWRDQNPFSKPPVVRVDHQIVDTPIRIIDKKVLGVADLAVGRMDMISALSVDR